MKLRVQFRLRTLLIVVTVAAILCGNAIWIIRDRQRLIEEREQAIASFGTATQLLHKHEAYIDMLKRQLQEKNQDASAAR